MTLVAPRRDGVANAVTVEGGRPLAGCVRVAGFKHSLVTIVAAAVATGSPLTLDGCPEILETAALAAILSGLGATVRRDGARLDIDPTGIGTGSWDAERVGEVHGAPYLVPGVFARTGRTELPAAGGCRIGAGPGGRRPAQHYAEVLRRFGAAVTVADDGSLSCRSDGLHRCEIDLWEFTRGAGRRENLYSGATKMALLCAAAATGTSFLRNPYSRAEVDDLVEALRASGTTVDPRGEGLLVTAPGAGAAGPVALSLGADLIEVVTWVTVGALLSDDGITISGAGLDRALAGLTAELELWAAMGISVQVGDSGLTVCRSDRPRAVNIVVDHRNGIFSDSHPFMALMGTLAHGRTTIVERVWPDRFGYVDGLTALGARVERTGSRLDIDGVAALHPAQRPLAGSDLRSAAVLLIAALVADGSSRVTGIAHLQRGYADLIPALVSLGATIRHDDA